MTGSGSRASEHVERPLRLLHVLYTGKGGLGTYFTEFVASDTKTRFAHRAVFYGVEDLDAEYERFVRRRGIPFVTIRKHRGPDPFATARLIRAMSDPTDAIVLHSGAGAGAIGGMLRSAVASCPLIHVEHTPTDVKTKRDRLWTSLLRRTADRTVTFYPEHLREFSLSSSRCVVVPKSPEVGFFRPAERGRHNEIRVGMQARLSPHKDQPTLLRAFAIASKECTVPMSLHIAGGGSEAQRLKGLADELGISKLVVFCGVLDRTALRAMLQSLDVYVHATHGETMCYAIMEAQACGLPVVGSDVRGVRDAIEEGVTGLLFPHQDASALADLIQGLGEDASLRQRLGQAARSHVEDKAKQYPTAEAYYEILVDILGERGGVS